MEGGREKKRVNRQPKSILFLISENLQLIKKRCLYLHIWVYRSILSFSLIKATAQENLPGPKKPAFSSSPAITEHTSPHLIFPCSDPPYITGHNFLVTRSYYPQWDLFTRRLHSEQKFIVKLSAWAQTNIQEDRRGREREKVLLSAIIRFAGNHSYLQLKSGNRCSRYHSLIAEQRILQHVTEM